jgi:hypothetical protein
MMQISRRAACAAASLWLSSTACADPRADAAAVLKSLLGNQAGALSGTMTTEPADAGYSGPLEVLRARDAIAVGGGARGHSFQSLLQGETIVHRVVYSGDPFDPASIVRDVDILLDESRLIGAAEAGEWVMENEVLVGSLPKDHYTSLTDASPTIDCRQLPEMLRDMIGKPEVESVTCRITVEKGHASKLGFEVVRTIPSIRQIGQGGLDGAVMIGGSGDSPSTTTVKTTIELSPIDSPSRALAAAVNQLTPHLKKQAPAAEPGPRTPTPARIEGKIRKHAGALLRESDGNKDGELSNEELGPRWKGLKRFDADSDGAIGEDELVAALTAALGKMKSEAPRL